MDKDKNKLIAELVYTFSKKVNISDKDQIDNIINMLCSMNIDDAIDSILTSLNDLYQRKIITLDDIYSEVDNIIKLNPEKYRSIDDIIDRLSWIKSMNMECPKMPLEENHRLVIETFDKFNELIAGRFDCYYTGGLMGYLATNHKLERYHGDLDLFINEQQLISLKELVDSVEDFSFISNMDHKEEHGHEYIIVYKGTPMSIGLFLFERQDDNSITTKEYYYDNNDTSKQLFVNEHHYSKSYTDMSFSNLVRYHNGIPYRMNSLESIYNAKKNSRPKDRHDAEVIKDNVDMMIDYKIDIERRNNFNVDHRIVSSSAIQTIEQSIKDKNSTRKI